MENEESHVEFAVIIVAIIISAIVAIVDAAQSRARTALVTSRSVDARGRRPAGNRAARRLPIPRVTRSAGVTCSVLACCAFACPCNNCAVTTAAGNFTHCAGPDLAAKLGQMIMAGFRGLAAAEDAPIVADIVKRNLGAVVLFSFDAALLSGERNVQSPDQLAQLTRGLQGFTRTPLLIAADQEGGRVARLDEQHGFGPTVSAQALGERGDPVYTFAQAQSMAKTLAAAGINHNLAPVVDVNTNPDNPVIGSLGRSFSANPAVVIEQARAFIEAHHAHGVSTTLKHFPGHGSSQADSHLGLVDVSATWQPLELEPYRALIGEGLADSIMTAHVFNAQLDPDYPATLSKAVITGILREQLGYDGVVITDDMNMGAITAQYGFEQAAVLAVQAGADVLAYGNNLVYNPDVTQRAIAALLAAVERGELSEARIDESCGRIMRLKKRNAGS